MYNPVIEHELSNLTASNGNGHLPERLPWRVALRARWRKAKLMVTRAAGTFTVREGVAYVFLAAALTFGAASYWRSQEQHDEIIRLRTLNEVQEKKDAVQDSQVAEARATAQIADRNAARLEGKFDQFSQIYAIGNPKKSPQLLRE